MLISGIKIPKILFIKGVFKKDCSTDDIFEKKILENIDLPNDEIISSEAIDEQKKFISYDKLPSIFENYDMWPKRTNIHCWHCTLNFDTTPVFIPKVIEPKSNKKLDYESDKMTYSISTYGIFCSFGCANKFIESRNYSIIEKIEMNNKLKLLHKFFYKKIMTDYVSYPDPYQMQQYGGNLSPEEFKEIINNCGIVQNC